MKQSAKKSVAVALGLALVLVGAGFAYSYWTTGGSGSGSAGTGTVAGTLTIVQASEVTDLRPGGAAQELSGTFNNPVANGPVFVTSVTASIDHVTKDVDAVMGDCDETDYDLVHAEMAVGAEIAATGAGAGAWGVDEGEIATIQFHNKATNQDACKGATVTLAYSSN